MTTVLVTGASGFVGQSLCRAFASSGNRVLAAVRSTARPCPSAETIVVGEINGSTDWQQALQGVDIVVHLAARAHLGSGSNSVRDREFYMAVNAEGTERLARACLSSGVRALLYMSSVKVNGEETFDEPFRPDDAPAPRDHYGESKWWGEQAVQSLCSGKLQWSIVRAPLVYGPGVRANFLRLMCWVDSGWPMPFGSVHNHRSLIYVENLSNLIVRAMQTGKAAGRIFMAADGEDLSTPTLCRRIAEAMGRRVNLWCLPPALLTGAARLTGLSAEMSRLTGSLVVDASATFSCLGWSPAFSAERGIKETVEWYLQTRHKSGGHVQ